MLYVIDERLTLANISISNKEDLKFYTLLRVCHFTRECKCEWRKD